MNRKDTDKRSEKKKKTNMDIQTEEGEWTIEEDHESAEVSGDGPEDKIKKLKKKLKECEREKSEYLEGWLRAKSDLVNIKSRYEKEAESVRSLTECRFAERLLPVMDSFSMAVVDQSAWNELPEGWRKGMENVHSQLRKVFDDYGITTLSPKGESFDPSLHEAVGAVEVESPDDDNVIIEVIQDGYVYGDRLLRTAKVKVGNFRDRESETDEGDW